MQLQPLIYRTLCKSMVVNDVLVEDVGKKSGLIDKLRRSFGNLREEVGEANHNRYRRLCGYAVSS